MRESGIRRICRSVHSGKKRSLATGKRGCRRILKIRIRCGQRICVFGMWRSPFFPCHFVCLPFKLIQRILPKQNFPVLLAIRPFPRNRADFYFPGFHGSGLFSASVVIHPYAAGVSVFSIKTAFPVYWGPVWRRGDR